MVGPVAVLPERQQEGYGKALMLASLGALDTANPLPQILIGDEEYYGRFFGFSAEHTGDWYCPGPFDRERLLLRCENPRCCQRPACSGRGVPSRLIHAAGLNGRPPSAI